AEGGVVERCVAAVGAAGAGGAVGCAHRAYRPAYARRLDAQPGVLARSALRGRTAGRPAAALSVFSCVAAGRRPGRPGPGRRLAGRMEMGRHTRATDPASWRGGAVVARRRAPGRAFP